LNGASSLSSDELLEIETSYQRLLGHLPRSLEQRHDTVQATDRVEALRQIEALRRTLINANPLGPKVGQLVHFGQLVALGQGAPARLHASAARFQGATLQELVGVAELALITAGMPAYALGMEIIAELMSSEVE
jgi:4-carboxymuconolactone decarboxylase